MTLDPFAVTTEHALHRVVYISRNEITGSDDDVMVEVDHILACSRANNTQREVTGTLMFNRSRFAQVLEGPLGAVETVFGRIQVDDRHSRVEVITFEPIAERHFATWSMGAVHSDRDLAEITAARTTVDSQRLMADEVTALALSHLAEAPHQWAPSSTARQ